MFIYSMMCTCISTRILASTCTHCNSYEVNSHVDLLDELEASVKTIPQCVHAHHNVYTCS